MTFGMLLGRSFAALRHNPKVLFGFAVVIQLLTMLVVLIVLGAIITASVLRLQTVLPGSDDAITIQAGTAGLTIVLGILAVLLSAAVAVVLQGIVAADVALAALSRKGTLRALWKRMAPSFWRLLLYAVLQGLAVGAAFALIGFTIFAVAAGAGLAGTDATALTIILTIALGIGCIPLFVWLSTKLLLVPSILVLERATLRSALVRSWRLTRGRFWVAFGVVFLISLIMGVAANVVSVPGTLITSIVMGIVAPTGDPGVGQIVVMVLAVLVPQLLVFGVQAIGQVVQCTGATLVYVDSRMRYEGLDQTLIAYQERSAAGWSEEQLGDPYAVDPSRAVTKEKPQAPAYAPPQQYGYAPQGYAQPAAPYGYGQPPQAPAPGAPSGYGQPQAPAYPPYYQPAPAQPAPPTAPAQPAPAPPAQPAPPAPAPPMAVPPPPSDSPWAPPSGGA
jgi:membrane-anchored glycerophosphoryl diester phosphodiesterase (GDPDase)